MNIVGIGGTLRKGSYSRALLLEAQKLAPEGVVIELTDIVISHCTMRTLNCLRLFKILKIKLKPPMRFYFHGGI